MNKKIKNCISILVILTLVLTITTPSTTAFFNNDKNQSFRDKVKNTRNNVETFVENTKKNIEKIKTYSIYRKNLEFNIKYKNIEKTEEMSLYRSVYIDINEDGKDDLKANCLLLPGIVFPLSIAINLKLKIKTLQGFNELEEDASFDAKIIFERPGIFSSSNKGDTIGYGYHSPDGELIPKSTTLSYLYVPHFLSFLKKPEHILRLNVDSATENNADLDLIFTYSDYNGTTLMQEDKFKVSYSPVVNTEICFGRKPSGIVDFERKRGDNSNVNLLLTHWKNDNISYVYAKDLPEHVTFDLDFGAEGCVEFDTHGDNVSEIGFYDSPVEPLYKIYFTNMGGKAGVDWYRDLSNGIANVDVYTTSGNTGFNVDMNGDSGGYMDFDISSNTPFDTSLEMNLPEGFVKFFRSNSDLSVSLDVQVKNESLGSYLNSASGSFEISKDFSSPFTIKFDKLREGIVEVGLCGKSLDITDFYMQASSPLIGGSLSFSMDHLLKVKLGNITLNLSVDISEGNVSGSCGFKAENGVDISNLTIKYNNAVVFHRDDFVYTNTVDKNWPFVFNVSVEWRVYNNSGYIKIHPGSFASFSFDSGYWNEQDELIGAVSGEIKFKTVDKDFNITWETIDGNLSFSIDGSAVASLKDFNLWIKDRVDVSIPEISVNFELNTIGKDGTLIIYLDDTFASGNINIADINVTDLFNITLKGSIAVTLDTATSGTIDIAWNESGITSIKGDFEADATGSIDVTDFEFNYKGLVDISMGRFLIDGGLNVNFSSIDSNISFYADVVLTDINISDLSVYSSLSDPIAVSADMDITFEGSGIINIEYSNDTIIIDGIIYDDSNIKINSFWFLVPGINIQVNLESFHVNDSITIIFDIDTSKDITLMVNLSSEGQVTSDVIFIGYPNILEIFIYDFILETEEYGSFGLGFNQVTSQPVFSINKTIISIDNLQFKVAGVVIPLYDISLEGTALLEGFLDIAGFSYVYLRGEVFEDTIISIKNMDLSIFGTHNLSIVLQPGELDIVFQNTLSSGGNGIYVLGYSSSWVTIKVDDKEFARIVGTLDLWVDLYQSADGTFSLILDAKEASGAIVIADSLRVAGELNAFVEASVKIISDEESITVSDLFVNISGEISAVVQIKTNGTDWIPIIPFSTSGQTVLFIQSPAFMQPPNIITDFVVEVPYGGDNKSLTFEVWYAPPLGENSSTIGPFTYNVSYGDGEYYEVTTYDTRIVTNSHLYYLDEYSSSVTVTTSDASIDPLEDDLSFSVIEGLPTYLEISQIGQVVFTYYDLEDDGRFHTWFEIKNKNEEDYILEWEAYYENQPWWPDFEDSDPILDPENGVLNPKESTKVNFSFLPPVDYNEYALKVVANNTNYLEDGTDKSLFYVSLYKTLEMFPADVHLPSLNPSESITSSIWIHNKKQEVLNWEISDYPNEFYSFSSMQGSIPPGSAEIVHFTITAPNEEGFDLGGEIKVIDSDDPVFFYTSNVHVATKGQSSPGNGNVTITEEVNGNVSIAIGGSNEIHVNNFQFEVNGVYGELDGHFILDMNDSYVYINFTQGNIAQTLSVDGSAEFTIQGFRFAYGDDIFIEVSKIITGGIHFYDGRAGNFTIAVDDTFTDIDIDVTLNQTYANFTIAGNIDIDVSGVTNGSLWINWDLNNDTKDVTIDGNMIHDYNMDISITDLEIAINNFTFTSSLIHFNRTVNIYFNETGLQIETYGAVEFKDIYFNLELGSDSWSIFTNSNVDIDLDGSVSFSFYPETETACMHIYGYLHVEGRIYAEVEIMNFNFAQLNGEITVDGEWLLCVGPNP